MAKKVVTITLDEEKFKQGQQVANFLGISFSSYVSILIAEDNRKRNSSTEAGLDNEKQ